MKKFKLYHGGKNEFTAFSLNYLGTNGTAQGAGVYLTPAKEIAEMYAEGGFLYTVSVSLEEELSLTDITIPKNVLSKIINILHKSIDILNIINDVEFFGEEIVRNEMIDLLQGNESDVDLYNDLVNISGDAQAVAEAFQCAGRYTHIVAHEQTRLKGEVIIVLNPRLIEILEIESV